MKYDLIVFWIRISLIANDADCSFVAGLKNSDVCHPTLLFFSKIVFPYSGVHIISSIGWSISAKMLARGFDSNCIDQ
jgi:hypothetical protein